MMRKRHLSIDTSSGVLSTLKNWDAYAKPLDDFKVKTTTGALVTLISALFILFLVSVEFFDWTASSLHPSLVVDRNRREKMQINLNITFPHLPCYLLTIDVMDVSGEHQNDVDHTIYKERLDRTTLRPIAIKSPAPVNPKPAAPPPTKDQKNQMNSTDPSCGSCYGGTPPESGCCNTCEDVRIAYDKNHWSLQNLEDYEQCVREGIVDLIAAQQNEGCNLHGTIHVNKVAGNFHFAPGKSFEQNSLHIHDLHEFLKHPTFDFTHFIHSLNFGDGGGGEGVEIVNPLDGVDKKAPKNFHLFQYFLKVVGTKFAFLNGTRTTTNQFSVTEHEKDVSPIIGNTPRGVPGIFFNYEISPMLVIYTESKKPFAHFLTDVCAIVGGIFTVAGLVDGFIYTAERTFKRKLDLGKAH